MLLSSLLMYCDHHPANPPTDWEWYTVEEGYVLTLNGRNITSMNVAKDGSAIVISNDSDSVDIKWTDIREAKLFKLVEVKDE